MGFYSFGRIKIVSRSSGASAVSRAAYHAGIEIKNEYDGVTHDYSYKKNVGETFIRMPDNAPDVWLDESVPAKERVGIIWNDVEKASLATNARLARSNFIALQHNLTLEQNLECVDRFIKENCTSRGMGVVYTVHMQPDNLHVDVMYLAAEYDKSCKVKEKSKKEYLCRDKDGNEVYLDAQKLKAAEGYEKVYKYKKGSQIENLTAYEASMAEGWERVNKYPVSRKVRISGFDEKDLASNWRKSWEQILNDKFQALNMPDRVDSRSYAEIGTPLIPTKHEGYGSKAAEIKAENKGIKEFNSLIREIFAAFKTAVKDTAALLDELKAPFYDDRNLEQQEIRFKTNEKIVTRAVESELMDKKATGSLKSSWDKLVRDVMYQIEKIKRDLSFEEEEEWEL